MKNNLLILGAGGHGHVVAEIARSCGYTGQIAFLDDGQSGVDILGKCADFLSFTDRFPVMFPAIGSNAIRQEWIRRLNEAGVTIPSLIHPTAYVSPSAQIRFGTVVEPKAIINCNSIVCSGCIIGLGAIIDHDTVIDECCHINSGAIVQAGCHIPAHTRLDSGYVFTKNGIR